MGGVWVAAAVLASIGCVWAAGTVRRWWRDHAHGAGGEGADTPIEMLEEELFKDFFYNAATPLHIFAPDRTIIEINQAELDLIGYTREEILGRTRWDDLIVADQREKLERHWAQLQQTHEVLNWEYTLLHKSGRRIHVLLSASARFDPDGRLLNTRGAVVDITQRKEAEEALKAGERRYRTLVENILGASYRCEPRHPYRVDQISEQIAAFTGRAAEVFLAGDVTIGGLIHPDDVDDVARAVREGVVRHRPFAMEYRMMHADGRPRWVDERGQAIYGDDGETLWLEGVIMDVTDRKAAVEALQRSESLYRTLVENVDLGISLVDTDFRIVVANPTAAEMVGADVETMAGRNVFEVFLAAEPSVREQPGVQATATGRPAEAEVECLREDGSRFQARFQAFPLTGSDGESNGFIEVVEDVSERLAAQRALAESERKYHNLFDTAMVGLYRTRISDGKVLAGNQAFADIMGYDSVEQLEAEFKTSEHYLYPEQREELLAYLAETGRIDGFEIRVTRRDGSEVDVAVSSMMYPERNCLEGVIIDISERKRAEEALRASEASYRTIFNSVSEGIIVLDRDTGEPLDVNPSLTEMVGYTREELLGMKVSDWSTDEPAYQKEMVHEKIRLAVEEGPQFFEWRHKRKSGEAFWCEVNLKYVRIAGKDGVLAVIRDIDERKRAAAERRRLRAQVEHAQKLESLGVLAGGIAHDFNNLLVAILGNADLALMDTAEGTAARTSIEEIKHAAKRASDLTNQMLAYSGKGRFVVSTLDLNDLVREMGRLLKVSISKMAVLRYDLADDLPAVEADASQLRQVVMNLITNASDAIGSASGVITLRTAVVEADKAMLAEAYLGETLPEGAYVRLEVSDTGVGMDAETRRRLFEPFYSTKFSGRGLGLAAVLGIVRGHHGCIKVRSELDSGSTFEVMLPAAVGKVARPGEAEKEDLLSWRGEGTVLVVDDEQSVRDVAAMMLRRAGFDVLTAADGAEAVELFKERGDAVDVVLLDMTMPRMGGADAYRELRKLRPDVKVILSSGYSKEAAADQFGQKGLVGFLQKPFELEKLIGLLREILNRR